MLVATLSQVLTFADLGVGAPVATASAQLDDSAARLDAFRRTLLTACRTLLASAAILTLVAVGIGAWGLWEPLLGLENSTGGLSANAAVVLALLAFAMSLPFALGEATLRGGGRIHEAVLLTGLSAPASLVLTVVLRSVDAPAYAYALSIPLGLLLVGVCCGARGLYVFRGAVRGLAGQVLRPRRFPGSAVAAMALPWFVVMIGLPIALSSDRIIIAHRADAVSLSNYSYATQLYTPLWSVLVVAALALWPVFAGTNGRNGSMRRSWLMGMAILGASGVVFAAGFLLLGGIVIGWMSAGTATPDFSLMLCFAALLVVQAAHVTTGILLISPGQLRFQAVCVVLLVLTNVPLSWVLTPYLGATGPVLASVITVVVCQLAPGLFMALRATRTSEANNA
jgi:O-antigen/teichoic acid export membrane protein